jgi:SAM-dependent methyltransferase
MERTQPSQRETDRLDYWINRDRTVSKLAGLKSSPLIQWLMSVRAGDEAFLRRELTALGSPRVLDVACGAGKVQIPQVARATFGADVPGFPRDIATQRGYVAFEYSPPDYRIALPEPVDAITCIDLNAHVDFATFERILRSSIEHLVEGGRVLIIGEFDNTGVGYRFLKCFPGRFQRYVIGMKHWHFTTESQFVRLFEVAFPELHRESRIEVAPIPPLSHFYACLFGRDVRGTLEDTLFRVGDVPISLINNLICKLPRVDSAFRVGYVYAYDRRS